MNKRNGNMQKGKTLHAIQAVVMSVSCESWEQSTMHNTGSTQITTPTHLHAEPSIQLKDSYLRLFETQQNSS
jgi:hypothetical protein